jgi:hypothetical protein
MRRAIGWAWTWIALAFCACGGGPLDPAHSDMMTSDDSGAVAEPDVGSETTPDAQADAVASPPVEASTDIDASDAGVPDAPQEPDGGPSQRDAAPEACVPVGCDYVLSGVALTHCGTMPDGCGGTLECTGTCSKPGATCGGGGVANDCGCTPFDVASCPANGCGTFPDGCGGTTGCGQNDANGSPICPSGESCGGGGVANVCGSTPTCFYRIGDSAPTCDPSSTGAYQGWIVLCPPGAASPAATGHSCTSMAYPYAAPVGETEWCCPPGY